MMVFLSLHQSLRDTCRKAIPRMTRFAAKRFVYGHLQLRPFWNRDLFPRLKQTTQQPLLRTICTIGGLMIVLVNIRRRSYVRGA